MCGLSEHVGDRRPFQIRKERLFPFLFRIGFYNFSWRDMGVPDLDKMMDIVQVGVSPCAGRGITLAIFA